MPLGYILIECRHFVDHIELGSNQVELIDDQLVGFNNFSINSQRNFDLFFFCVNHIFYAHNYID